MTISIPSELPTTPPMTPPTPPPVSPDGTPSHEPNPPLARGRLARTLELFAWASTTVLVMIAFAVLVGWWMDSAWIKHKFPQLVEMNPMVAAMIIAAAVSLSLRRTKTRSNGSLTASRVLAGLLIAISAMRLQFFITRWDSGIDQLLFHDRVNSPDLKFPNHMAPIPAVNLVMCGLAILLINVHTRRGWRPAQALAMTVGASALLALLAYAFGGRTLVGKISILPTALYAAICFVLLSVSILCAFPHVGVMRLITSDSPSGVLLRRLLPSAVLVPTLLALFRLIGLQLDWFDPELGVAILVVMTMAVFGVLAWINAKTLEQSELLRKQADIALNAERNLLRRLIDNIPDHIFIKDAQGQYVTDNVAHARFVGLSSPDQITGKLSSDLFPPELASKFAEDDRRVMASSQSIVSQEEPIVDRQGKPLWMATTKIPLHDANGKASGLVCVSRDITLRRKAEQEMLELQNFLFSVIENIPNMVFVKDAAELRFVRFNSAGEELLGYPREELLGKNDYDLFPKEEADFFIEKDRAVLRDRKMLDIPAEPVMTRRGMRILHTKKMPILINGEVQYLLGISEDITDRVAAEEQLRDQNLKLMEMARSEREANDMLMKAQSQMLQTEKLAAMGQLVAGVAHEINNPLSFVSNNVAVLQRDLAAVRMLLELYRQGDSILGSSKPELMAQIREKADAIDLPYTLGNLDELMVRSRDGLRRIQNIVKDLRDFARLDESDLQEADVNHGIESTVNIVRGRAKGKQVEITLALHPLRPIACYPAKINQVVMNLVSNAIDASNAGGMVTVRSAELPDGSGVRIDVIDTGTGIPPGIRERIFDPFFTTKPQGEGTGLGLSISYGIVRDHGGTIDVESTVGQGTAFIVKIPFREMEADSKKE